MFFFKYFFKRSNIIGRAISSLTSNGVEINKEMWMKEAVGAEIGGSILTCQSLIRSVSVS